MSERWDYDLAKEFKKRDNKKPIGPCIGVVLSTVPAKISIQDGHFILEGDMIYICNQILERKSKYTAKTKQEQSGSLSVGCPISGHSGAGYTANGTMTMDGEEIHAKEVWQVGDKVMVVPDESGQHFFIVDILRGV